MNASYVNVIITYKVRSIHAGLASCAAWSYQLVVLMPSYLQGKTSLWFPVYSLFNILLNFLVLGLTEVGVVVYT